MTKILPCTCQHAYQDARYGRGMRVHNQKAKQVNRPVEWACSVCSPNSVDRLTRKLAGGRA